MLENLDKIDWSKLHHAYGTAEDVPDLLRALASPNKEVRDETYEALYSNIWHQGSIYEATAYAVPFLIELLQQSIVEEKDSILMLLDSIADGSSYHAAHAKFSMFKEQSQTEEYQRKVQIKLDWVRQAYLAVREGIPVYYSLINHIESMVRAAAAKLLANFTEKDLASVSAQLLYDRFNQEDNTYVKNNSIESLGSLLTSDSPERQLLYKLILDETEQPRLRELAATTLAKIVGSELPNQALEVIVAGVELPKNQNGMHSNIKVKHAAQALALIGVERGTPILTQMLTDTSDPRNALTVAEVLLNLTFEQQRQEVLFRNFSRDKQGREHHKFDMNKETEQTIKAELENGLDKLKASLNEWQKQAIAAIVNTDALWEVDTNLYLAYRLPTSREELRSLL